MPRGPQRELAALRHGQDAAGTTPASMVRGRGLAWRWTVGTLIRSAGHCQAIGDNPLRFSYVYGGSAAPGGLDWRQSRRVGSNCYSLCRVDQVQAAASPPLGRASGATAPASMLPLAEG